MNEPEEMSQEEAVRKCRAIGERFIRQSELAAVTAETDKSRAERFKHLSVVRRLRLELRDNV